MEILLFWIFAVVAMGCGFLVVWHRNPMNSAIYLVITMLCLAGLYVLLMSGFVATVQILIYAGAVMVLMLFVIMMLNLRADTLQREGSTRAGCWPALSAWCWCSVSPNCFPSATRTRRLPRTSVPSKQSVPACSAPICCRSSLPPCCCSSR